MKKLLALGVTSLLCINLSAQNKLEQDRNAIKSMAGCYKVTFNFAETFSPDSAYVKHNNYKSWAYELVKVIEDQPKHIALQHLLIVNEDKSPMVIKHWRQDWDYENTDFYMFKQYNPATHGQEWTYVTKSPVEVKGQWSQKVFQVDDSPRYEGTATWVHYDGRHYWENTTDAPLPRREYSKRHDYNVTKRTNNQEITDYGWLHQQDNAKVLRTPEGDKIIAYEKGWNTYEKVDNQMCQVAEDWWKENHKVWKNVRAAWKKRFNAKKDLKLWPKKGDKLMYQAFFNLEPNATQKDASKIINEFSK
ncbi:hypothetical protein GO491_10555 [Flavobacteriaceae bacterium Ap0902]|nr:hypothetical protein [Flavobacteriaceae bacterium Ap0902]